ncbi:Na+/H+ antiporter NhaC [Sporosarcina sp. P21c]|uniref:Na+/H+ antiporter NhaC n=1 Tax=Sporosarcina TaxID=1569 RepID=UPI000A16289B|nr:MULTISPECIES: Na+/H+ antiporter NhaC [Sporosarcina]ARJ38955.1 Na+/H+ antiporter NhaC [Sporosarcina ureae]PIC68215.1 Na+/H+ antiporter NhaC [Sporosarcina sp. P16a]PIC84039.1 Na+/H+ antiporter NhaC [Sporosarcina sp. P1]PIC90426.1 Na+/H+ antiporter NhaC [Sporosarcina sp. P21c]PIC93956.1 Na+/H+ antiporter NhaC [Sporosarcina sp. P25]
METQRQKKDISFWWAILPLVLMIMVMIVTVVKLEQGPHMPLIVGTSIAALVAWRHGFSWKEIEEMMYKGIRLALPAVIIIMLVGLVIGSWMGGGIVATMIFYGLKIITPSWFLVAIALICAIVSLAIGSSWSTMATIGVAGMGIGLSMGIPAGMVAGAVISGAYFGDKMSPLSDTTNLAAGLTGTDLFDHIKHMLYTTIPGLVIALAVFTFLGRKFGSGEAELTSIAKTSQVMQENFVISPWLLLVPLVVIVMVAMKIPAVPALIIGIVLGFLAQVTIQSGTFADALGALQSGFAIETGNQLVDKLFNGGGLDSMMYTVSMTIVAMTFGGILEYSGMLRAIMMQLLKVVKSTSTLIISTIGACVMTNATCSEQYVSIVVPSRMFSKTYKDMGLSSKNLSRALEDGGTLTSVFIPWNTCGVFIFGTLGVSVVEYGPYAILNFAVPLISIIYALTGFSIVKMTSEEIVEMNEQEAKLELEAQLE